MYKNTSHLGVYARVKNCCLCCSVLAYFCFVSWFLLVTCFCECKIFSSNKINRLEIILITSIYNTTDFEIELNLPPKSSRDERNSVSKMEKVGLVFYTVPCSFYWKGFQYILILTIKSVWLDSWKNMNKFNFLKVCTSK